MNPFGFENVNSPFPPLTREGFDEPVANPSLRKVGEAELSSGQEVSYETRRTELSRDVRKYADKMHARLLDIYKKYGATDAAGMQENVLSGKAPKLEKSDVEAIQSLLNSLEDALAHDRMPKSELPSLELFEETIEQMAPRKVIRLGKWESYTCIDGKLNGIVTLDDLLQLPIINGKLVYKVKNNDGSEVAIYQTNEAINTDGKLTGCVTLPDGMHRLVFNGVIVDDLPDSEGNRIRVTSGDDIEVINGELNCRVWLPDGRSLPVIDGVVITTVRDEATGEERPIYGCGDVHNVDGKLNGHVQLMLDQNPRLYPVIGGKYFEKITDFTGRQSPIDICTDVRNVGGKLNGVIKFEHDGRHLPIINGELIQFVEDESGDSYPIDNCSKVRNIDGRLNCIVEFENHAMLPVVDGVLLDSVKDRNGHMRRIEHGTLRKVNGELFGIVVLPPPDSRMLPVLDGELVEEIENQEIWGLFDEGGFSDAGGVVNGDVLVLSQDGERIVRRVFLGKFAD